MLHAKRPFVQPDHTKNTESWFAMEGKLYLIATPIGNLEDITLRALETLRSVDLVAAEDTRRTRQLLSHFEIHARLISYHAFNEHRTTEPLLDRVQAGEHVAVVSDAGTPAVADPGFHLVREAVRRGIEPVVIPGVSALTFAATAAGLPVDKFAFYGFVPVKAGRRRSFLERLLRGGITAFCFESPYRIGRTLRELAGLAPTAAVALIREATKVHEEIRRGSAAELAAALGDGPGRGEYVLGVYLPADAEPEEDPESEEEPEAASRAETRRSRSQ